MKKANILWSQRLLRSKNFVVMTDTDSAVHFVMKNPYNINNKTLLMSQRKALTIFIHKLQSLMKDHDKAIEVLHDKSTKRVNRGTKKK